ncbi:MAG: FAD-binding oxidoreductase [Desulfamplus sp.]|nr:FAD-binding oxidoreductase [Desulfamplus sp.]
MTKNYDVILIGAGSVGVPTAMSLGALGVKTAVIDKMPSPGQGENKHAIGGIRATHSDPGKIIACMRSIEIFSTWKETYGDDIEWLKGGYLFPVYREKEEQLLKSFLPIQKKYGLEIDYIDPDMVAQIAPGINRNGLMGGTFSPNDGSASPLITGSAFFRKAVQTGNVDFYFKESVKAINSAGLAGESAVLTEKMVGTADKRTGTGTSDKTGEITKEPLMAIQRREGNFSVVTDKDIYNAPVVIDAAGPFSRELGTMVNADGKMVDVNGKKISLDIPVFPDSHEGGVTEPVEPFFKTMLVDLRPAPGSKNYYFYQNGHGHIIFCITPDPPILGFDKRETSVFLPQVASRMLNLMPRLKNIRVRRVWRGLYPMTPDGSPILGWNKDIPGLLHATGMCGQGYMLGPGIGEIIGRMVTGQLTETDKVVTDEFSLYREFGGEEALK